MALADKVSNPFIVGTRGGDEDRAEKNIIQYMMEMVAASPLRNYLVVMTTVLMVVMAIVH